MLEPLNFVLPVPTLKQLSLAKIQISLIYAGIASKTLTFKARTKLKNEKWHKVIGRNLKILHKLRENLDIPESCQGYFEFLSNELVITFESVFNELQVMFSSSGKKILSNRVWKHFSFTPYGLVDVRKTYENVIRDASFPRIFRFRLACDQCMKNEIISLWMEIHPREFYNYDLKKIRESEDFDIMYWSMEMMGREDEILNILLDTFDDDDDIINLGINGLIFKLALDQGYECLARYICQKCSEEEKISVLNFIRINHVNLDIHQERLYIFFLSPKQLEELFQTTSVVSLFECVKYWPWSELFLRMFNSVRRFIDSETYFKILLITARNGVMYGDNLYVFDALWLDKGCLEHRQYVLNRIDVDGVALLFCELYDYFGTDRVSSGINLVLQYVEDSQLEAIIGNLVARFAVEKDTIDGKNIILDVLKICASYMIKSSRDVERLKCLTASLMKKEKSWKSFVTKMGRATRKRLRNDKMDLVSTARIIKKPYLVEE